MCKYRLLKVGIFFSLVLLFASTGTCLAAPIYYYAGPDYTGKGYLLELRDFKVEGPVPTLTGDVITVKFKLKNWGQNNVFFGNLGVYAAYIAPNGSEGMFGNTHRNKVLKIGKTVYFEAAFTLDSPGVWTIWPSFQVSLATGSKKGPRKWHAAVFEVGKRVYPDLVVVNVSCAAFLGEVSYAVVNVGEGDAPRGVYVVLYVNESEVKRDYIVAEHLSSGRGVALLFRDVDFPECASTPIMVCVDPENLVEESNETNNCFMAMCAVAVKPLNITSGPRVVNVTETSAIIVWTTNEESDSAVFLSTSAVGVDRVVKSITFTAHHAVLVDGLEPGTTYRVTVVSRATCNRSAVSDPVFFRTRPRRDEAAPKVKLVVPERLSRVVNISALVKDNFRVARVVFLIDGNASFTDFSSPYVWTLDTRLYDDGLHNFTALAFDEYGNMGVDTGVGVIVNELPETELQVTIETPPNGASVLGSVVVNASIVDTALAGGELGYISRVEVRIDDVLVERWIYTPFEYDPLRRKFIPNSPESSMTFTYWWSLAGLPMGSNHAVNVTAWDSYGAVGSDEVEVSVDRLELPNKVVGELSTFANIEVERIVERRGNYFYVRLIITNTGTQLLSGFVVHDELLGFQAIPLVRNYPLVQINYDPTSRITTVEYTPNPEASLSIGGSMNFEYYAVPILAYPPLEDEESIIGISTRIDCRFEENSYSFVVDLPYAPQSEDADGNGRNDLDDALKASDYLIITNPAKLAATGGEDSQRLFVELGWLARYKRGTLGYIYGSHSADSIKRAISFRWAPLLDDSFATPNLEEGRDAYLLIVGESEIVPSYTYENAGGEGRAKNSDNYYADTLPGVPGPDLVVGRIVGNDASKLIEPVQASIDVFLGGAGGTGYIVTLSGYESGWGDIFVRDMVETLEYLQLQGWSGQSIHWSYFVEAEAGIDYRAGDRFALGDVDEDGLDEIIIATPRDGGCIYAYELNGDLAYTHSYPISEVDAIAAGDIDADGVDEILVVSEGRLLVFRPGEHRVDTYDLNVDFMRGDGLAAGHVVTLHEENVVIVTQSDDTVHVYSVMDDHLLERKTYELGFDYILIDKVAVGDADNSKPRDEVVIGSAYYSRLYVINLHTNSEEVLSQVTRDGESHRIELIGVDGLAVGDVDDDGVGDIVVISRGKNATYRYFKDSEGAWTYRRYYSRFYGDWFRGVPLDGVDVGRVIDGENPKIVILHGISRELPGKYYVLASHFDDIMQLANRRLQSISPNANFVVIMGHGNPSGASPTGVEWSSYWSFDSHPLVYSFGCSSGYYEGGRDSYSFADALLDKGAAVYIASTESVGCGKADETVDLLFSPSYPYHFFQGSTPAGKLFTLYERERWRYVESGGGRWIHWVCEWNYYGDPKYPGGG